MGNTKRDKIPKDKEEAEKYYGDDHNNQQKKKDIGKSIDQEDEDGRLGKDKRKKSNVLTHPRDEDDESFEIDHNKKKKDRK